MKICCSQFSIVKNYIIDTNVLLHDPDSLLSFEDNNVLIPIEVIEEIDRFKREMSENGRHARSAVGMGSLPNQISVEIEGVISIKA